MRPTPLTTLISDNACWCNLIATDDDLYYPSAQNRRPKIIPWNDLWGGKGGGTLYLSPPIQDWERFEIPYRGIVPQKKDFILSYETSSYQKHHPKDYLANYPSQESIVLPQKRSLDQSDKRRNLP